MKKHYLFRQFVVTALTLCLTFASVGTAFGDDKEKKAQKSAKKNFSEGLKAETAQQWESAAQSFALAVASDPGNPEYRLHLVRALTSAATMFVKRGDAFVESNDYASAYNAYKQAYQYDPTNEIARVKMERMIEMQKAAAGISDAPNFNPRTGNVINTSGTIDVAAPQRQRSRDLASTVQYDKTSLRLVIQNIARQLGLNIVFDETFRDNQSYSISLNNVTLAKALDIILVQNKLTFEMLDRRTLLIYQDNPTNRGRFERLLVKTFYISNANLDETRQTVTQLLATGGQPRQIAISKQLNALIVRGTAEDLRLVQEVLDSIDKNRAEVAVEIEIYEVSHTTRTEIGNQIALNQQAVKIDNYPVYNRVTGQTTYQTVTGQSAGLTALGGIGNFATAGLLGNIVSPAFGLGTMFGLPPTTLSLLQQKDNAKLLNRVRVHALDGQANKTRVGQSVPVRLGSNYVPGFGTGTPQQPGQTPIGGGYFPGSFDSIQYQDAGLVIDVTPTITNDGYVEMKMTIESKTVEETSVALQPKFGQRTLTTVSRIQDGRTGIVAGIQQETRSDGRASIPVIGLLPILGRFMTTPKENKNLSDIIITVTPHIIRAPEIKQGDHLAKQSGPSMGGTTMSIETVMERAQYEDDQDRRIIARQSGQPVEGGAQPMTASQPAGQPLTQPAAQQFGTAPGVTPVVSPNPPASVVNTSAPAGANGFNNNFNGGQSPNPQGVPTVPASLTTGPAPGAGEGEASKPRRMPSMRPTANPPMQPVPQPEGSGAQPEAEAQPAKLQPLNRRETDTGAQPPLPEAASEKPKETSQAAPVNQAAPAEPVNNSPIGVSLRPGTIKQQVGKTFLVVVTVNGDAQMTGANLALNFDPAVLQLRAVRDGGMLGTNPDLTHQVQNGNLLVTVQQSPDNGRPARTNGRLLVLEFAAVGAGQTVIDVLGSETKLMLAGDATRRLNLSPVQVEISRENLSRNQ
jgi:general secretion pathway protein D